MIDVPPHRAPEVRQLARWFAWEHLTAPAARMVGEICALTATSMIDNLPDGPELAAGLRKLVEAKDCLVRAALDA